MFKHEGRWLYGEKVVAGDTVERVTKISSYGYQGPRPGRQQSVSEVARGPSRGYMHTPEGVLEEVFDAKIKLGYSWYLMKNFKNVSRKEETMSTIHSIEQDKPTFLREFKEVLVDGVSTREYIGEWIEFKNTSSAKLFAQNEISTSIRSTNEYRKFALFSQTYVAQAKQPEIEFV